VAAKQTCAQRLVGKLKCARMHNGWWVNSICAQRCAQKDLIGAQFAQRVHNVMLIKFDWCTV